MRTLSPVRIAANVCLPSSKFSLPHFICLLIASLPQHVASDRRFVEHEEVGTWFRVFSGEKKDFFSVLTKTLIWKRPFVMYVYFDMLCHECHANGDCRYKLIANKSRIPIINKILFPLHSFLRNAYTAWLHFPEPAGAASHPRDWGSPGRCQGWLWGVLREMK